MDECLTGVRVLELSEGWSAAAVCGRLLADLGATVTTFERSGGDGIHRLGPIGPTGDSYAAIGLHRGKETVVLAGLSRADLVARAVDANVVLIDETWARALAPIGLDDPAAWRAEHPSLVVGFLTPVGREAATTTASGSELVVQALAGVASVTGHPTSPPTRVGVPLATNSTALIACSALHAALYRAEQTGVGASIDLAAYDAMVMMGGNFLPGYLTSGRVPQRVGNLQLLSAPWNSYPTKDGMVVVIAISESLWQRLLTVIGHDELIGDTRYDAKVKRVQRRDEVDGMIGEWTSRHTTAEAVRILEAARIPASGVKTTMDVVGDGQLRQRGVVTSTRVDGTDVPTWGSPFRISFNPPGPTAVSRTAAVSETGPTDGKPLSGLRVLEVGGHTAGGMSTRLLADLGADVIKVEMPQGDNARDTAPLLADGYAYLWHFWNTGKRSIVLNVGDPAGHALLLKLVADSDVFLENMALDTVEKLGLTAETLTAVNPGLVYCSVSGFGLIGDRRYRRAFDTVIQAEAGIMSVTGAEDGEPVKAGPSAVDNVTALAAVAATTAALRHRARTGAGAVIDLSLFDVGAWLTAEWWPQVWAGQVPAPLGNRHPYHDLYDTFRSQDDRWVAITATHDEELAAARVLFALGDEPATWPGTVRGWTARRRAADVVAECALAGVPAALVQDVGELVAHPLTRERAMLPEIAITETDTCLVVGSPYKFVDEPPMIAPWRRVPALGQHTDEILRDLLGIEEPEREALRAAGVTIPKPAHHS